MQEKRCFTYCGDDKCDCEAAPPFSRRLQAEDPMTYPHPPVEPRADGAEERLIIIDRIAKVHADAYGINIGHKTCVAIEEEVTALLATIAELRAKIEAAERAMEPVYQEYGGRISMAARKERLKAASIWLAKAGVFSDKPLTIGRPGEFSADLVAQELELKDALAALTPKGSEPTND